MKPFFVLLGVFALSLGVIFFLQNSLNYQLSGKIAISAMLLFTAIGHFKFTSGMALMIPNFIPAKTAFVYFTGIAEVLFAVALFPAVSSKITGILMILFFILVLPANIYASAKNLNYETGLYNGRGMRYLWFRIPFQILLILWTYFFCFKLI